MAVHENYYKKEVDMKYNFKILWKFLGRYKGLFFGTILVSFLIESAAFFDNFVFKYLVDKSTLFVEGVITAETFGSLLLLAVLVYLGVRFFASVMWWIEMRLINSLEVKTMSDLEKKSFSHILNLSYRFHLNKKTGSIISQFTRGVSKVESVMDAIIFHFVPVLFRFIISAGVIFYFDFSTAIALLVMTITFVTAGILFTHKQKIPQNEANYREDILKQNLADVFANIETVKYFGKEKRTIGYFGGLSHRLRDARYDFWNYFTWASAVQTMILGLGVSAIFYLSFGSFLDGQMTLGSITLIYAAVWKLIPMLFSFMHGYRSLIRSNVDVTALFSMFKEENEVKDIPDAKKIKVTKGEVEFDKVDFAYPGRFKDVSVLKNFDLKIKPKTKIALVGPSGSGKIIKVLYRLFDLNKGRVLIDGQDIAEITQESLRNSMSIVPQEPILFDNTIWFNISYANPKASIPEVWRAIKFAQLDKFIKRLPRGEKTIVGERGVKLSGGEKQRVSIARAILADKKILVLDEATSALDSETELEIQKDLEKLMKGRTTIMIAHRLSTIMKANKIVVLNEGRIVEIGTHQELANKRGGLYRRLWDLQKGGML